MLGVAELIYPTKYRAKGPWLLETSQLLALDRSVDEYLLKSCSASAVAAGNARSSTAALDTTIRRITFRLRHDKELETSTFQEAILHPAAMNENILGLKYEINLRDTTASLVLEKNKKERIKKQTSWVLFDTEEDETEMQIMAGPRASLLNQELFGVLKDWATGVQPPIWQRWIINIRFLGRTILFFWIFFFAVNFFSPTPPNFKEHYKQEARKLLDQGINANNQQKAIELLIAIESDYVPSSAKPTPPTRSPQSLITNLLGLFVVSVVAFFPELCIGIGKGKQYLRWWQTWVRFVSVTVPGLLMARYAWPQLFSVIERSLGH
jgi:hypothetical protein